MGSLGVDLRVDFDDSMEDDILVEVGGGVHTRFASKFSLKCWSQTTNFAVSFVIISMIPPPRPRRLVANNESLFRISNLQIHVFSNNI